MRAAAAARRQGRCGCHSWLQTPPMPPRRLPSIVALLPANNLAGPALFDVCSALQGALTSPSTMPLRMPPPLWPTRAALWSCTAGFGKNVYTALATINGSAVGIVATERAGLCHNCVAKAVPLCPPVRRVQHPRGDRRQHRTASCPAPAMTWPAASARLPVWLLLTPTLPPPRSAVLAGKAVGPVYTALANADLTHRRAAAAPSAPWRPTPRSPCCTRTRSTLPITSLPLPRPRPLPTPLRCAALPMPLWPAGAADYDRARLPMPAPASWPRLDTAEHQACCPPAQEARQHGSVSKCTSESKRH